MTAMNISRLQIIKPVFLLIKTLPIFLFFHCDTVQQLAKIQKPTLSVERVKITSLNFESIGLTFDLKVFNPNKLAVTLAGFDYDFLLNNASFLKGSRDTVQTIKAKGESILQIPIRLGFRDLYRTFQELKAQDSTAYKLNCGLSFNLPILGKTRIPVSKTGFLPLPKLLKIKVQSLKLNKLGFTGADLLLNLQLDNPNAFRVFLNKLNYNFTVDGQSWVSGLLNQQQEVGAKGKNILSIPISLNFLKMGKTALQLLQGNKSLDYKLGGDMNLRTSLPMFDEVNIPVQKSGKINLQH
ncbi:MAG TPA: hypothetical protein ENK14_09505 [Caldithrix sp.]|nr:hypothetical protein [Caldithrix sp.]